MSSDILSPTRRLLAEPSPVGQLPLSDAERERLAVAKRMRELRLSHKELLKLLVERPPTHSTGCVCVRCKAIERAEQIQRECGE